MPFHSFPEIASFDDEHFDRERHESYNAMMGYVEKPLGKNVRFLLPSLKLKLPCPVGTTIEQTVHEFLMQHFGGYTATAANLFGYWTEEDGAFSYGEHREFTVALKGEGGLPELKQFLGEIACTLDEKCLYVEVAGKAILLYGTNGTDLCSHGGSGQHVVVRT